MPRPRLLFGALQPDTTGPFFLLPEEPPAGGAPAAPAPPAGAAPPTPPAPPAPGAGDAEFPANTPVDQMTAPQQVAYWKHHSRKHETSAKALADWQNQNKSKVDGYDKLVAANQTEQEKAIADATATATAAGRAEMIPHLLQAKFEAAAGGKITPEQAAELVAPLNPAHFLDEKGAVDTAKVSDYVGKYIGASAPPANGGAKLPNGFPDLGQGKKTAATVTGKEQGLAEAQRRGWIKDPAQQTA